MSTRVLPSGWVTRASAVIAAAAGVAGFAGAASAATFTATDTASFVTAVTSANMTAGPNTIMVSGNVYQPTKTVELSNTSGSLTIQGPGPDAGTNQTPAQLDGSSVAPFPSSLFKIDVGVTVAFANVQIVNGGGSGTPAIDDFGTLRVAQTSIVGNNGAGLTVEPNGAATIANSTLSDGLDFGLIDAGTATLTNTTVVRNANGGIDSQGTLHLVNTIVAKNGFADCTRKPPAANTDHSLDGDGTCNVGALSSMDPKLGQIDSNGGPTPTDIPAATSPALDAGNPAACPTIDQRGAPRPDDAGTSCDVGAVERSSTPPVLVAQDVTAQATDASGAVVNYTATFTDPGAPVNGSCVPASGSTFPVGATTVSCTGTDSFGNVGTGSFKVKVTAATPPPTAAYTPSSFVPGTGQTVTFDARASSAPAGAHITAYRWIWGDGTPAGSGVTATHVFASPGTVSVRLYVTDSNRQAGAVGHAIIVGAATPAFTPSTYAPAIGQTVSFDASASSAPAGRTITAYRWVWGDGSPDGSGVTATHAFGTLATVSVGLYVTDSTGVTTAVGHGLTVGPAPTARYTASTFRPTIGQTVSFDASASSAPAGATIVGYRWVWGDGTPDGSGATATHAFATPGTYSVGLYVTDSNGQTNAVGHGFTVLGGA